MKRFIPAAPIVLGLVALGTLLAQAPAKGKNYAFMVACGKYYNGKEFGELPYTIKELLEFREVLVASGDYKEADIKLLHNDMKAERFQPRRRQILDELEILLRRLNPEDTVMVVFNGHGIQPKDDPISYFCPIDASVDDKKTFIPLEGEDGIFEKLKQTTLKRKLLIVNACRDDPNVSKPTMAARKVGLFDKKHKYDASTGVAAMFSCQPGQFSFYYPDEKETKGRHRSLFFHHLIESWQGKYSTGKEISLEDVFREVKDRTSAEADTLFSDSQVPFMKREYEKEWLIRRSVEVITKEFTSKTLPSLKLVRIPAKGKTFTMGSPVGEKDRFDNETPHEVTFSSDYYLGVTAVTRGQFGEFVKDSSYQTEAEKAGDARTWQKPGIEQTDDHPVVYVSWNDAVAFCGWLKRKDGKEYRLPTEAEWEYGCRGGTQTAYYFGDDPDKLDDYAWFFGNSKGGTHSVGTKKANAFGLYDMHGNVWQWCSDWYGADYYANSDKRDPQGPTKGSDRVYRGGSWDDGPRSCRSAYRNGFDPAGRGSSLGFRLAVPVR